MVVPRPAGRRGRRAVSWQPLAGRISRPVLLRKSLVFRTTAAFAPNRASKIRPPHSQNSVNTPCVITVGARMAAICVTSLNQCGVYMPGS